MAQLAKRVDAEHLADTCEVALAALDVVNVPVVEKPLRLLQRAQALTQFVGLHVHTFNGPAVSGRGASKLGRTVVAVILSRRRRNKIAARELSRGDFFLSLTPRRNGVLGASREWIIA